ASGMTSWEAKSKEVVKPCWRLNPDLVYEIHIPGICNFSSCKVICFNAIIDIVALTSNKAQFIVGYTTIAM
ncbi:hypothetical protein, partial [Mycobacterium tuberculosis]